MTDHLGTLALFAVRQAVPWSEGRIGVIAALRKMWPQITDKRRQDIIKAIKEAPRMSISGKPDWLEFRRWATAQPDHSAAGEVQP